MLSTPSKVVAATSTSVVTRTGGAVTFTTTIVSSTRSGSSINVNVDFTVTNGTAETLTGQLEGSGKCKRNDGQETLVGFTGLPGSWTVGPNTSKTYHVGPKQLQTNWSSAWVGEIEVNGTYNFGAGTNEGNSSVGNTVTQAAP